MKTNIIALVIVACCLSARATSTIDTVNRNAYAANAGWLDARADGTNGAVIGEFVCSNFLYAANLGWISLGGGNPTNGIYYSNSAANDCQNWRCWPAAC